jgi:hypothetical protein
MLITGEDIPRGASVRARLFIIEVLKGDVNKDRLTGYQDAAAAGLYASAMAGFLRWLAPQFVEVKARLPREHAELRDRAAGAGDHARTPSIVADLALGLRYFLRFAVECGAITPERREALAQRAWAALLSSARTQADHVREADPVDNFLRLLLGAVTSGRAHLAAPGGGSPEDAVAWGWQVADQPAGRITGHPAATTTYASRGNLVGWIDGDDVYLLPKVAFSVAQELARAQDASLPVTEDTLWRRMEERQLLTAHRKDKTTLRRTVGGKKQEVHYIRRGTLLGERGQRAPENLKSNTGQGVTSNHQRAPNGPPPGRNGQTGPHTTTDEETTCEVGGPRGPLSPFPGG